MHINASSYGNGRLGLLIDKAFFSEVASVAAAETLPRFRQFNEIDNKYTSGFDPVTEADRAAERAIRAVIGREFPDHGILGEEYGPENIDRSHVWVIDPVDGTRAFISGLPVWGTLVGLTVDGDAKAGMMSQPFTGELFYGDANGSYLLREGAEPRRLSVRAQAKLEDATMFTTTPALFKGDLRKGFDRLESAVRLSLIVMPLRCWQVALPISSWKRAFSLMISWRSFQSSSRRVGLSRSATAARQKRAVMLLPQLHQHCTRLLLIC
jgi:histidinol phosphatase-like enzyme (inositol monophosphatase family)